MFRHLLYFTVVIALTACNCQKRSQISGTTQKKEASPKAPDDTFPIPQPAKPTIKNNSTILLKVEPERLKSSDAGKMRLTLTNSTTENITTGTFYYIEFYEGGCWKRLNLLDKIIFEDIAFNIKPSDSKDFTINLQLVPHKYMPGEYRIGKEIIHSGQKSVVTTGKFGETDHLNSV